MQLTSRTLYGIYTVPKAAPAVIQKALTEALAAGLTWLQIRDKNANRALWPVWEQIAQLCQTLGAKLIINDQLDLAQHLCHLMPTYRHQLGVHLGQGDRPIEEARQCLPAQCTLGITCHGQVQLAQAATLAGADYVAFGRFFPSNTKPTAVEAQLSVIEQFQHWQANRPDQSKQVPIAVIGGIHLHNITQLTTTAAQLFAVSEGIWGSHDITQAVQDFQCLLKD